MPSIRTDRLVLVAATRETCAVPLDDHAALAKHLEADVPAAWPPELCDDDARRWTELNLAEHPELAGWYTWFVLAPEGERRTLVGLAGLKGPPADDGWIEVGYGILPAWQRRGIATEATAALIAWALRDPRVLHVAAETYPHLVASVRVMEKLGMRLVARDPESGIIRYGKPARGTW
ncbi:MAG TPA: GNAT family N-acetyltransferase [Candidatus Thermoplasmatota archaeon]|nr:GNAT family N-acetyltransferase [Candidatus Thermoplasmatota archaeon]